MQSSDTLRWKYTELVYNGFWFSTECEALQTLITETQRGVAGIVGLKLYICNIIVSGRRSPESLYDPKIATMEGAAAAYDRSDATGFLRLKALRLKSQAGVVVANSPEPPSDLSQSPYLPSAFALDERTRKWNDYQGRL